MNILDESKTSRKISPFNLSSSSSSLLNNEILLSNHNEKTPHKLKGIDKNR